MALLQADVPPPAARRVAESLEKDMTSNLATRQDLQHLDQLMVTRFEALESRMSLMVQNLESRLLVKLGALITIRFGVAGSALALLR
jgi:hypothetical protein